MAGAVELPVHERAHAVRQLGLLPYSDVRGFLADAAVPVVAPTAYVGHTHPTALVGLLATELDRDERSRLALAMASRQVVANALGLIGVSAPERM